MNIIMVNEKNNSEKNVNLGLNYFLLFTSPLLGITLFKNGFTKLGLAMLISILIFIFNIVLFSFFTSTFANYFSDNASIQHQSTIMQLYYMLDLDYSDILENFIALFFLSLLSIISVSVLSGIISNRIYAKSYLDDGYKFLVESVEQKDKIKRMWRFKEEDFI